MAVVINEFEVVDSPPQVHGTDSANPPPQPTAAPLDPEDLRQMLAVSDEQQLRRFAH
jgi:hypothetical protein